MKDIKSLSVEGSGGRQLRILIGTSEIAANVAMLTRGFRALGHHTTSVNLSTNRFYGHERYDIQPARGALPAPLTKWLIDSHDLFVFIWSSLQAGHGDLLELRRLGKKIAIICVGDDVRHWSAFLQDYGVDLRKKSSNHYPTDPLERPLAKLRMYEYFADAIFSMPNQASLAIRPYFHFTAPFETHTVSSRIPGRDVPVVVHAPSEKGVKGSRHILGALDRLRARGVAFELRLLEGVPNPVVHDALQDADVAIDQLYLPGIGRLSLEAMASGCALATCIKSPYAETLVAPPVCHIDEEGVEEQLLPLLSDRDYRMALATSGRRWVETHDTPIDTAKRILHAVSDGANGPFDHYPGFYTRAFCPSAEQTIPTALASMAAVLVQRWGMPASVDLASCIQRGVLAGEPNGLLIDYPRWPHGLGTSPEAGAFWTAGEGAGGVQSHTD